jgi:hypothetical protein
MGDSYDADRAVTYIGPRALGIGFALYCIGFLVLLYAANWIGEAYEGREASSATIDMHARSAVTPAPVVAPPVPAAAPPRAHAGVTSGLCAPAPPCAPPAVKKKPALPVAGSAPASSVRPAHIAPSVIQTARPSAPLRISAPAARASQTPAARASEPPAVRAAQTPAARVATPLTRAQTLAALLVPFSNASGLTSSGGLDPRAGAHPPLVVGPNSGLGPNPAATPFGGEITPRR